MKRIAIVSDLHVGDYAGLWHPDYVLEGGGGWKNNPAQRYLLRIYQDLLDWYPERLDAVIINGDVTAGENPAERGARLVTTDIKDQAHCAAMLLDPLRQRTEKFWVIRGTPYHIGRKAEGPEALGQDLEAMKWPDGRYSGMWLVGKVEGTNVVLDVSHEIPQTLVYMSTSLEREGVWARRDRRGKGISGKHIIMIRSHRHEWRITGGVTQTLEDIAVGTPCFQIQTPFAIRKSPNKLVPDLGGILIEINEEAEDNAIKVLKRLYKHPRKEVVVI